MGAGLTGRLWSHSLSLEASVLLCVWVMAELDLSFKWSPGLSLVPRQGTQAAFGAEFWQCFIWDGE